MSSTFTISISRDEYNEKKSGEIDSLFSKAAITFKSGRNQRALSKTLEKSPMMVLFFGKINNRASKFTWLGIN